jgi:RNA polymerase sigma-54 factor
MGLEQRLQLRLAQKLVMTPTLQQAIKLLQVSRLELEQALTQEVQTNPLLELVEEQSAEQELVAAQTGEGKGADGELGSEGVGAVEEGEPAPESYREMELEALFANYLQDSPSVAATWEDEEEAPLANTPAPEQSLFAALTAQLGLLELDEQRRRVCEFIVGNLDSDGYLRTGEAELAEQLGVSVEEVGAALATVQALDPPGIAARSLQECFTLQLERIPTADSPQLLDLAKRIVKEGFDDLLHQRWPRLLKRFDITSDELRAVLDLIRRLDPRPGNQLGPMDTTTVVPDLEVRKVDGEWRVILNDDGLPRLRLSPRYVKLLQERSVDGQTASYLRERMRAALWFLRSVEQRQSTILKVAEALVRRQQQFFEVGVAGLRPLVLRDIADDVGIHESTVSRVVANKFIATPRGVYPLKFFFHSSISHALEGDISSVAVKERIRELIQAEDPEHPLSDARVARQLNRQGIRIARRTVAKYREELGIPSSEQRGRLLK